MYRVETQHVTKIHTLGSQPAPFRRTGCARVGSDVLICGGTRPTEVEAKGVQRMVPLDVKDVYILHLSEWSNRGVGHFLLWNGPFIFTFLLYLLYNLFYSSDHSIMTVALRVIFVTSRVSL